MIRDKEEEITKILNILLPILKKIQKEIEDEEKSFLFWGYTNWLTEGFVLVDEDPEDWSHSIGSLVSRLYHNIDDFKISGKDLVLIKHSCEDIFYEVYGRSIKDESKAPSIFNFFSTHKVSNVITYLLITIISAIVTITYCFLHWCADKFSCKIPWLFLSDNVFPFFIGLWLTLFLTDRSRNWITVQYMSIKWKFIWYFFQVPSKIKHKITKIFR